MLGKFVISSRGSDKGCIYIMTDLETGRAFLVDGRRHKLEKPKKKNIKHIIFTGHETVIPKTDNEIVTAIRRIKPFID